MDKVKTFFLGVLAAIGAALVFFFRQKERAQETAQAIVEKDKAELNLKEIEAKNAIDEKFKNVSDNDVVLNAIDEQLRRDKPKP